MSEEMAVNDNATGEEGKTGVEEATVAPDPAPQVVSEEPAAKTVASEPEEVATGANGSKPELLKEPGPVADEEPSETPSEVAQEGSGDTCAADEGPSVTTSEQPPEPMIEPKGELDDVDSPRRPVRRRTKPIKYADFVEYSSAKRKKDISEEEFDEREQLKPKALFSSDDVEGQEMFQFKSHHTKSDLQNKVKAAIGTPLRIAESSLRTPNSVHKGLLAGPSGKNVEATPKYVKDVMKKRIIKEVESDSEDNDFCGSNNDFVPDIESGDDTETSQNTSSKQDKDDVNSDEEATPKYVKDVMKKRIIKEVESDSEDNDFCGETSQNTSSKQDKDDVNSDEEATPKYVKDVMKKRIIKEVESDSEDSDFCGETSQNTSSKQDKDDVNSDEEATPKYVKNVMKKRTIKEVESDSEDSDFCGATSQNTSSVEDDVNSDEEVTVKKKSKMQIVKNQEVRRNRDSDYIVTPDNYFMMHSSKKITTSDHTLATLKNLNLNEKSDECYISEAHKIKIDELNKSYEKLFNKWLFFMCENFNIILYGFGSKRDILQKFQKDKLEEFPCIVINGFFPSLTMKSILETIVIDLLENTNMPSNNGDVVSLIDSQLSERGIDLFLIIHNIDGERLRNNKAQALLASLAELSKVHMIASIDHINAPLLWDHSKLSKFNFSWYDVTTFKPYSVETSFENSMMAQHSGALQLSSLRSVFQSLTSNAKGIFNVIINYQLENMKQHNYQGFPFKDLYSKCREQFLVSSDLALRTQLTEFLDHKLVKMKQTYDGSENLIVPIDHNLLQQFLEQQEI